MAWRRPSQRFRNESSATEGPVSKRTHLRFHSSQERREAASIEVSFTDAQYRREVGEVALAEQPTLREGHHPVQVIASQCSYNIRNGIWHLSQTESESSVTKVT